MNFSEFKSFLASINEIIYFDSSNHFRENCSNLPQLKQIIIIAEELLDSTNDEEEKYFLMGTLGNLYRILGESEKAIILLTDCITNAIKQKNRNKEIVSLIRLGEAFKYNNNQNKALQIFNDALKKCEHNNSTIYLDFVLQHKGKCLLELNRIVEAEECLTKALKLRENKGDVRLIKSTQQVLNFIEKMKK